MRYLLNIRETDGTLNTVGFTYDTRTFLLIPARPNQALRMDSDSLAGLVARDT